MWSAPASSIARRLGENRVTVYSALKNLAKKGIVKEGIRNSSTHYSVASPQELLARLQEKCKHFQEKIPEFVAIESKLDNKPQVQFFDGLGWLKALYTEIGNAAKKMSPNDSYLTFVGIRNIDSRFQKFLKNEFLDMRKKIKIPSKVIMSKQKSDYSEYHKANYSTLVIDDPVFDFADEIVIYGESRVAIIMYTSDELCGLNITSVTLYKALKSIFQLIWKLHNKK